MKDKDFQLSQVKALEAKFIKDKANGVVLPDALQTLKQVLDLLQKPMPDAKFFAPALHKLK
jgi:hypothetical protein